MYLDDILIFSLIPMDHLEHVWEQTPSHLPLLLGVIVNN